jgi:hypothetical protein
MFPGCVTLEVRARHEDILREAEALCRGRHDGEAVAWHRNLARLGRSAVDYAIAVLASFGLYSSLTRLWQ